MDYKQWVYFWDIIKENDIMWLCVLYIILFMTTITESDPDVEDDTIEKTILSERFIRNTENPCFWSSLVFTTNILSSYVTGEYLYSLLFGYLTISSLVVHSYSCFWSSIIDRIFVFSVVLYAGYKIYIKPYEANDWLLSITGSTFLYAIFVYYYGYYMNNYCFCPKYGRMYHVSVHILCSIGHHAVMLTLYLDKQQIQ